MRSLAPRSSEACKYMSQSSMNDYSEIIKMLHVGLSGFFADNFADKLFSTF